MDRDIVPEDLTRKMDKLKQQLQVVSKRVSTMILRDWPSYSSQLKDIDEIQKDLDNILSIMQNIRELVFFKTSNLFTTIHFIVHNLCSASCQRFSLHGTCYFACNFWNIPTQYGVVFMSAVYEYGWVVKIQKIFL